MRLPTFVRNWLRRRRALAGDMGPVGTPAWSVNMKAWQQTTAPVDFDESQDVLD